MSSFHVFCWIFCFMVIAYCNENRHHIDPRILEGDESSPVPTTDETFEPTENTNTIAFDVSILLRNSTADPTKYGNTSTFENTSKNVELSQNTTVQDTNPANIDTEVKDLLDNDEVLSHEHSLQPEEPKQNIQFPDKIDDDTELIDNGQNTEDELRSHINFETENSDGLGDGHLAIILVCSLTSLSVVCYAALLYWRRYLENRYGSRTMLVAEEFDSPNDMRHFSI